MYKSKLQELCQRYNWQLPEYTTIKDGPDHMPRFSAAVNVHGQSFHTPAPCRSAKEARNSAAQIAFGHFSVLPADLPPSAIAPVAAAVHSISPQPQLQLVGVATSPSPHIPPPDRFHFYKNLLQQYAQKQNLDLPVYTSEAEGPPHDRHFKARVSIDGKSFETVEFFRTLKEAEQAAAKVACQVLAVGFFQEDRVLYKNLLQEFAQKKGLLTPTYKTVNLGLPHNPIFMSTVEVGIDTFQGAEAKTKKQAETNAAKVAYYALREGCLATGSPKVSSINEFPVAGNLPQNIQPNATTEMHKGVTGEGCLAAESSKVQSVTESLATDDSLQNIQPTAIIEMHQDISDGGCPATESSNILSFTESHSGNSSKNIQPTTTIEMHQDVTDKGYPAMEAAKQSPVIADNSSDNIQPSRTEMHQDISYEGYPAMEAAKQSPVIADNSSDNIQPSRTEMHQDISYEGYPAMEAAKQSPVIADNSSDNIQPSRTEMHQDISYEEALPPAKRARS